MINHIAENISYRDYVQINGERISGPQAIYWIPLYTLFPEKIRKKKKKKKTKKKKKKKKKKKPEKKKFLKM